MQPAGYSQELVPIYKHARRPVLQYGIHEEITFKSIYTGISAFITNILDLFFGIIVQLCLLIDIW